MLILTAPESTSSRKDTGLTGNADAGLRHSPGSASPLLLLYILGSWSAAGKLRSPVRSVGKTYELEFKVRLIELHTLS